MKWRFNAPPRSYEINAAYSRVSTPVDMHLVERLTKSYQRRVEETPTDQWKHIFSKFHGDIHDALMSGNQKRVREICSDPQSTDLFLGFDGLAKTLRAGGLRIEEKLGPALAFDRFVRLAESMGARRTGNPETIKGRYKKIHIDDVIDQIEQHIGFELSFPSPFQNEYGLITKRGIASERIPLSIYQAWKLSKLGTKVIEIGGGLGRTAYFATKFGICDYTIVDIPISSLAQGCFLGQVVEDIELEGETLSERTIKLISPSAFFGSYKKTDAVLNVDSLTELGPELAEKYIRHISEISPKLMSINHEANSVSVLNIIEKTGLKTSQTRHPDWLRRGYVEEIVHF